MAERTKPMYLWEMPFHIRKSVVDNVDAYQKLAVRQLSKDFKQLADKSPTYYQSLTVLIKRSKGFEFVKFILKMDNDKEVVSRYYHQPIGYFAINRGVELGTIKETGYFIDGAILRLKKFLENRLIRLGEFQLEIKNVYDDDDDVDSDYAEDDDDDDDPDDGYDDWDPAVCERRDKELLNGVIGLLENLEHQLKVEKLNIDLSLNRLDIMRIIHCFEPRTLKNIHLDAHIPNSNALFQTDQWKSAEKVVLDSGLSTFSIDNWTHFSDVDCSVNGRFSMENLRKVIEHLQSTRTPWKTFFIRAYNMSYNDAETMNFLKRYPELRRRLLFRVSIPIPSSPNHIIATLASGFLRFEKVLG